MIIAGVEGLSWEVKSSNISVCLCLTGKKKEIEGKETRFIAKFEKARDELGRIIHDLKC